jgi:hypothetical protein
VSAWPLTVQHRTDPEGASFKVTYRGRSTIVRFHDDGTVRLIGAKGERWLDAAGSPVPREWGYPVVRIHPTSPKEGP